MYKRKVFLEPEQEHRISEEEKRAVIAKQLRLAMEAVLKSLEARNVDSRKVRILKMLKFRFLVAEHFNLSLRESENRHWLQFVYVASVHRNGSSSLATASRQVFKDELWKNSITRRFFSRSEAPNFEYLCGRQDARGRWHKSPRKEDVYQSFGVFAKGETGQVSTNFSRPLLVQQQNKQAGESLSINDLCLEFMLQVRSSFARRKSKPNKQRKLADLQEVCRKMITQPEEVQLFVFVLVAFRHRKLQRKRGSKLANTGRHCARLLNAKKYRLLRALIEGGARRLTSDRLLHGVKADRSSVMHRYYN